MIADADVVHYEYGRSLTHAAAAEQPSLQRQVGDWRTAVSEQSRGTGIVILAAGKGTRMKSRLPKVLHPVCGIPMITHVLNAARALSPQRIVVVVGHGAVEVRAALGDEVTFVEQTELLGTADAVKRCETALAGCDEVVVLNGDSPLIRGEMLQSLQDARMGGTMAFAVHGADASAGGGRVQRNEDGQVEGIVERRDGDEGAGRIERNAGQYIFDAVWLWEQLPRIAASDKGEYYLTVLPQFAFEQGRPAVAIDVDAEDVLGVDNRVLLSQAERLMRARVIERHQLEGVTVVDPATTYIDASVEIYADATILPNTYLRGTTTVGEGSQIGPGTTLLDSVVGAECDIQQSIIEHSTLGDRIHAGPFAHVRGGSMLEDDCYLGNYAEVNRSRVARGVKMHHFSYIGDAEVGEGTNIAAGIITCNYDGTAKHKTVIGRNVLLGSDTMLVAPVHIGDNASTGAGSVVTRDVAAGELVAGVPARPISGRRSSKNHGGN